MASFSLIIVIGLVFGIDTCAHRATMSNGLSTIAVIAHGFETHHPSTKHDLAHQILYSGGLLTEFMSHTNILKQNFVRRNRIIAGLLQATIDVESQSGGGAMLNARMTNYYNREVLAVPVNLSDKYAKRFSELLKQNQANLLQSADDILKNLSWYTQDRAIKKSYLS